MPIVRIVPLLCLVVMLAACTPGGTSLLSTGYNCLYLYDDVQIELNTHIARDMRIIAVSPDGKYQIGGLDRGNDTELFLVTAATEQRTTLQTHVAWGDQVVWSPDSQVVYYSWGDRDRKFHTNLVTVAGKPGGETISAAAKYPRLMSFSPDSQYIAVSQPSIGVRLFSTRDYPHPLLIAPFDQWAYANYQPAGQYWSSTGDRLAYTTETELVILNAKAMTLQRISVPYLMMRGDYTNFTDVKWSPDDRRILLYYFDNSEQKPYLYLFDSKNSTLIAIDLPNSMPYPLDVRWASRIDLTYASDLQPPTMGQRYNLLHYNVETRDASVTRLNIPGLTFNTETHRFLYLDGTDLVLDDDGTEGPISRIHYLPQTDKQLYCLWPYRPVVQTVNCHIGSDWLTWIREDPSTTGIWLTTSQGLALADNIPLGFTTEDERFLVTYSLDGEPLKIRDLTTHQSFSLPINDIGQIDPNVITTVSVFPAPDRQSWLVRLHDSLYRYWLSDGRLETIPLVEPGLPHIRDVLWSPDGLRYAVLVNADGEYDSPSKLLVYEADGRSRWSMGMFEGAIAQNMIWTQCGDALAPIRDWLAAETP